ncbi:MAG: hypothetical protein U0174_16125 [Polyangiaceae bacterium]
MTSARHLTAFACLLLSAAAVPACAVETEDQTESTEDELASMKYYMCTSSYRDATITQLELGISASKISVTDLSKDALVADTGTLVANYRPTSPQYQGGAMYSGFRKLQDEMDQNVDFILSKELKAKAASAKLYMRTQASDGGGTQAFWCKSKPKKLTVNPNQMGRIACSLEGAIRVDGPPPGETALFDVFLYQHDTETSKITFTYLDHFGVRATERKESISASTSFNRTSKKITGAWGKNKIDLTYRAGITYTGTFKLEDGQVAKVKCNDLAMLDAPR